VSYIYPAPQLPNNTYKEEREDDAANEDPLSDDEGHWALILRTLGIDGIGPSVGGKHGDGGVDIGEVDEEALDNQNVDPEVLKSDAPVIGVVVARVNKVELPYEGFRQGLLRRSKRPAHLVIADVLPLPCWACATHDDVQECLIVGKSEGFEDNSSSELWWVFGEKGSVVTESSRNESGPVRVNESFLRRSLANE
jgi:hypothetical protein